MMRIYGQNRQPGESMEQFKARRARGVCVNIQALMAEERELIGLCGPGDIVKGLARRQYWHLRDRYRARMAIARPLP